MAWSASQKSPRFEVLAASARLLVVTDSRFSEEQIIPILREQEAGLLLAKLPAPWDLGRHLLQVESQVAQNRMIDPYQPTRASHVQGDRQ